MRRRVAVAIAALALVAAWLVRPWRPRTAESREPAAAVGSSAPRTEAHSANQPRMPASSTAPPPAGDRPASLRGTTVDGDLVLDEDGNLIATSGALRLFDYFLTTLGESDLAGVRRMIAAEAERRVPGAAAEVLALFDRYVAYLDAAQDAARRATPTASADPIAAAREQLDRLEGLQRERFGGDAARLFGDEDALARVILDRSELVAREDLTAEDKQAQLDAIEARLPPEMQEARARMRAPAEVRDQVEAMRRRGASAAEIHALRASAFGEAAADRLDELDRTRGP